MDAFLSALAKIGPASLGWTLAGAALFLVLRGFLVPSPMVTAMREDADKRVREAREEAAKWHAAYLERSAAGDKLIHQNGELMEVARTARAVMVSLPHAGEAGS